MSTRYMALGFISEDLAATRFRKDIPGLDWKLIEVPTPEETHLLLIEGMGDKEDSEFRKLTKCMSKADAIVTWDANGLQEAHRQQANDLQIPDDMLTWIANDTDIAELEVTGFEELKANLL